MLVGGVVIKELQQLRALPMLLGDASAGDEPTTLTQELSRAMNQLPKP